MNGNFSSTTQISRQNGGLPRLEGVIVACLIVVGLYCPTSGNGSSSKVLLAIDYVICTVLLLLLMLKRKGLPSVALRLALLAVIPILLVFTVTLGLHEYSLGELASFAVLALMLMLNLSDDKFPAWGFKLFSVVNVINVLLGVAVLVGSSLAGDFLTKFYAQFDDIMVPGMMLMHKPVLTFATHSLAGFFYYLFFYANFQTYKVKKAKFFLVMAFCYLALTAGLLSVTGLLLAMVATIQVLVYFWQRLPHRALVLAGSVGLVGLLAASWNFDPALKQLEDASQLAQGVLLSQGNGFLGRFTPNGTMYPALEYIKAHPFSPLGLSRQETLLVGDMGLLDYFIRGSVFLVVWAYGGLFLFLRRSMLARSDMWFLFGVILAFELGFSALAYFRLPYLLPFFVIYLNELRRSQTSGGPDALAA